MGNVALNQGFSDEIIPKISNVPALNLQRWWQLCQRLGIANQVAIEQEFARITLAYGEPQRVYHTAQHIYECLRLLDWSRTLVSITSKPVLEMALWYHDMVYQPQAFDNERRSADQAIAFLSAHKVASHQILEIESLIMSTCHLAKANDASVTELTQWMLDIDLAILGAAPFRFVQYETQIREEYGWVTESVYQKKRRMVLMQFLEQPDIYQSSLFKERFETQARSNLSEIILDGFSPINSSSIANC